MISQLLYAGLVSGMLYALIGLGITVGFKATQVISFAHGMIVAVGAYIGVAATAKLGLPYGLAMVVAIASAGVIAWIADRLIYEPLLHAPHMVQVLATLGLASILRAAILQVWGVDSLVFPASPRMSPAISEPIAATWHQLLVLGMSAAAVAALVVFYEYTWWGRAIRASSQNQTGAQLCGIRTSKVFRIANVIAAMMGALAGVLYGPLTVVDPSLEWVLIKGFAVAALGGLASLSGTLAGGIILGVMENLWSIYFPSLWAPVVSYSLIVLVLLLRPNGLFSKTPIVKL